MKNKQEEITFDEFCKDMTGNSYVELLELWDEDNKLIKKIIKKIKTKFKPKTKEHWRKDAVVTFKTLLETTEYPKDSFTNKEKLINISINSYNTTISTSFDTNKKGKKDLIKWLKREMYL